jgi:hypothetical protein
MEQKFSYFIVRTDVVSNDKGKRHLGVGIRNTEDEYDGILMFLTPAEAKILSQAIYDAARAMEQQPVKEK